MPDAEMSLSDRKKEMEKKLHDVLMDFERTTGLAVVSIEVHRLDHGRVLPVTSDAISTKVELVG
jgi:hypothetical protein